MTSSADPELFAVIMAGGSGTRFWPASRRALPKQFLPISGARPMITETRARVAELIPDERVLVVAGEEHAALVRECLPALPPENLLCEPVGRNTLPCVALAALEIERRSPGAVQLVLPADHVIQPESAFHASVRDGARLAQASQALVTFGIRPTFPATGYGYIEVGAQTSELEGASAFEVSRFVEKPDLARAQEFLSSGRFLWNSGMFVWSTAAIVAALRELAPEVYGPLSTAGADLGSVYPSLPSVPVDVGVMEKAERRRVLPIDYTWSDVGSWAALEDVHAADEAGNFVVGGTRALAEDASGCIVHAGEDTLTALIGVRDLIVVRTGEVTLVCPKDRAQDVRAIVERLKSEGSELA